MSPLHPSLSTSHESEGNKASFSQLELGGAVSPFSWFDESVSNDTLILASHCLLFGFFLVFFPSMMKLSSRGVQQGALLKRGSNTPIRPRI